MDFLICEDLPKLFDNSQLKWLCMQIIAVDLDGMLASFPKFFVDLINDMQHDNKIGVLTARSESEKEENLKKLKKWDIEPSFYIGKPDDDTSSNGMWKGKVCKDMGIDVLFDDFEASDPKMVGDFFVANGNRTIPFTSWGYRP